MTVRDCPNLFILSRVYRAIIGGTFDPPHLAHLLAAETAYMQLGVDEVLMMPAGSPWQKPASTVSAGEHRWAMTQMAVEGADFLVPDDREVLRDGWTYTADTLATFPESDRLVLVLGADAAANLSTWQRYDQVRARAEIAVVPRLHTDPEAVHAAAGEVTWLDMPILEISGSQIRERARSGQSVRFLVRDRVYEYMTEHGLYGL